MYRFLVSLLFIATQSSAETPLPDCGLYTYRATIERVIDGDTVVANVDLGFHTWIHDEHLRLFGIDAPELSSDEGKAIANILRGRIEGKEVYICTRKMKRSDREARGSFGRDLRRFWQYKSVAFKD
jgi:endonuclease YncB( thermonuclease family)